MGQLALIASAGLTFWLLGRDIKQRQLPSKAIWIPTIWLAILGSRSVSSWLSALGLNYSSGSSTNLEGNPVDMWVFLTLMLSAILILTWRKTFNWGTFALNNKFLILVYLYLVLSVSWSPYPEATFKRAFKDFGHVLVALVLLSEKDPLNTLKIIYVRLSYIIFPLSIVLIKYFPAIGRVPNRSGSNIFAGVATHKNGLGAIVFVTGLFLFIDLLHLKNREEERRNIDEWIRIGMLVLGFYLLFTCQSLTSILSLTLGAFIIWMMSRLSLTWSPRRVLNLGLVAIIFAGILEFGFDATTTISEWAGRGSGFSGRTLIWDMVKAADTNHILGSGFYTFWNSPESLEVRTLFKGTLASAHNGLLEMYLDGGMVGLVLLIILLVIWGKKSLQGMLLGSFQGQVCLTFWILTVFNNFSETHYFRFTPIWFTLLVLMINYPRNTLNESLKARYNYSTGNTSYKP